MTRVGFTGTRRGLTAEQRATVAEILRYAREAHHGDCEGADAEFHELARAAGVPVVIHPPVEEHHRAFCTGAAEVRGRRPFLERNEQIVIGTDVLVGCPAETIQPAPARGQGTWSTIRFAQRRGSPLLIAWPNGAVTANPPHLQGKSSRLRYTESMGSRSAAAPAPTVERLVYDPRDQPMKYLWLKYVEGVDLREHCQKCLLGPTSRRIGSRHIWGATEPVVFESVRLDEAAVTAWYLCGVSEPYDLRTNFHLALAHEAGGLVEYDAPGISIVVRDARRLEITPENIDPNHRRANAYMWKTCRNWQFAWAFSKGVYDGRVHEPAPDPQVALPI